MNARPSLVESKAVYDEKENEWQCCDACGRRLFYINTADGMDIQIKCPRCGKIIRIIVGVRLDIDT